MTQDFTLGFRMLLKYPGLTLAANLGAGRATLRFGRVWTGAMIVQVALAAIGIPAALTAAA